jgi:hypothetical protein
MCIILYHIEMAASSSSSRDETCLLCESREQLLTKCVGLQLLQLNMEGRITKMEQEIAALNTENARLKKYELQMNALNYGRIKQSTPIPGGFMGYGSSEWSSIASASSTRSS